jgi:predicted KAP-like P-loop ATPase
MDEALLADSPLTNPKDDRLGFAPFAENLAKSILKIETDECIVFALFGPWGSGKTTCMYFIRYYINRRSEENRPIVIEFNPWWFSGRGELLKQFLREFLSTLGKEKKYKKIAASIGNLLGAASVIPYAQNAAELLKLLAKEESIVKLKNEIRKTLPKSNNRFLIIIDDIDRLTPEEIRSLLCVIKAIADFPRTSYLLAFDKKVVIEALDEKNKKRGEDYLEKIVQVPFDLPIPEKTRLNRLFTKR